MSGQSDSFRSLLTTHGEWFTSNDSPRIPVDDELLTTLKREHGEAGRPDLYQSPRAKNPESRHR